MQYSTFGEFLISVRAAAQGGSPDPRLLQNALREASPTGGGFWMGETWSSKLLEAVYGASVLAQRCRRIPAGQTGAGHMPTINEESRADGSRYGGVSAQWLEEREAFTPSSGKLSSQRLKLKKLGALLYATNELIEDGAANFGEYMQLVAGGELGFRLDNAIVRGTGTRDMLGILNANATIEVSAESGQAAGTIVAENLLSMISRFDVRSWGNAAWYVNMNCLEQLYSMSLVVGAGGVPVFDMASSTLFGKPVVPIEQCSTVGTVGDIILADMSQYTILERPLRSEASAHVAFETDQSAFRFKIRIDGQPAFESPITPANGSATVSPFVTLETRS